MENQLTRCNGTGFLLMFKVGLNCHMNTILRLKCDWLSFPNILKSLSQTWV